MMSIAWSKKYLLIITAMFVTPKYAIGRCDLDSGLRDHPSTSSINNAAGIVEGVSPNPELDLLPMTAPVFVTLPANDSDPLPTQASFISKFDADLDATDDTVAIANAALEHDEESANLSRRDRRSLTYPEPSTLLLIFGLGTPLQLDSESVIVGVFTKMIYTLPSNSTDFTEPGVHFGRTKSRWTIYKVLERAVELYGFGAGKGCLLRAICEVAAAPFDLRHGLFGQMAQAFLSPSSTSEAYDEYTDREYHAAERLGRHVGQNCHALYPECERNVLDIFSTTAATTTTTTTTASST